jgi:hypothetical protein
MSDKHDAPADETPEEKKGKKLTAKEVMERALEALQLPEEEFKRRLREFEEKRDKDAENSE